MPGRLPNLHDRSGEFCVYKWVASHLSRPQIRNKCRNLSRPVTPVCVFTCDTSLFESGNKIERMYGIGDHASDPLEVDPLRPVRYRTCRSRFNALDAPSSTQFRLRRRRRNSHPFLILRRTETEVARRPPTQSSTLVELNLCGIGCNCAPYLGRLTPTLGGFQG